MRRITQPALYPQNSSQFSNPWPLKAWKSPRARVQSMLICFNRQQSNTFHVKALPSALRKRTVKETQFCDLRNLCMTKIELETQIQCKRWGEPTRNSILTPQGKAQDHPARASQERFPGGRELSVTSRWTYTPKAERAVRRVSTRAKGLFYHLDLPFLAFTKWCMSDVYTWSKNKCLCPTVRLRISLAFPSAQVHGEQLSLHRVVSPSTEVQSTGTVSSPFSTWGMEICLDVRRWTFGCINKWKKVHLYTKEMSV